MIYNTKIRGARIPSHYKRGKIISCYEPYNNIIYISAASGSMSPCIENKIKLKYVKTNVINRIIFYRLRYRM